MFYAKRNSEFYIFVKGPRARPKPDIRKPGPPEVRKFQTRHITTNIVVQYWILSN